MLCNWNPRPALAAMATLVVLVSVGQSASAQYTTSLGATNGFLEPTAWTVGDAKSTYQAWDKKTVASYGTGPHDNLPDMGTTYSPNPTSLTHLVKSPGFGPTGSNNFYSFSGDYGATANIYNHGTGNPGEGTYVIVQTGTSVTPVDADGNTGDPDAGWAFDHYSGVIMDSMQLLDLDSGDPILGGDNASAMISQTTSGIVEDTTFGDVNYEELAFEFFLPGYFGDFQVDWDQTIHASIDTLRVDTFIGAAPTPVPEPSSAIAMLIAGCFTGLAYVVMRRRKLQSSGN